LSPVEIKHRTDPNRIQQIRLDPMSTILHSQPLH
jgi:hypothetical protein